MRRLPSLAPLGAASTLIPRSLRAKLWWSNRTAANRPPRV